VIPIALSYRIIKNSANVSQEEKLLQTVDAAAFVERMAVVEEVVEEQGTDPCILLEDSIRKELEEETEKARQAILDQAYSDMEVLKEAARLESAERGYQEGFRKGYEKGLAETEEMRSDALDRIGSAEKAVKAYIEESEERILKLSVRIAEKIVHQTLDSHAEGIMLLARPILQEYGKTEKVILSCHPENVDFVRERLVEIEKYCPNAHILILEDKSLEQNGLVIENEDQIADLQVRKQLERFLDLAGR
jgi:flagellar assembly protein FliH